MGTTERSKRGHSAETDKGFSLIELLIVIAILGILAVVVVLSVGGTTTSAKTKACEADFKTLQIAAEAYNASTGGYPLTDAVLLGTTAAPASTNPVAAAVLYTPAYLQGEDLSFTVTGATSNLQSTLTVLHISPRLDVGKNPNKCTNSM